MRNLLLTIAAAVTALFASAGAPNGYYNGISGLKDAALKNKLYEIVSKHSTNSTADCSKNRSAIPTCVPTERGGTCIPTSSAT